MQARLGTQVGDAKSQGVAIFEAEAPLKGLQSRRRSSKSPRDCDGVARARCRPSEKTLGCAREGDCDEDRRERTRSPPATTPPCWALQSRMPR